MKKIWLTAAGSLFIALASVNAQQQSDSTRTKTKTKTESTNYRKSTQSKKQNAGKENESGTQSETSTIQGQSGTQGQTGEQSSYEWREDDRQSIGKEELPSTLVETLRSDEYKGWENATIYRNKTSNGFMLVLQDNGDVKTFYFDKEGKKHNHSGSGTSGAQGHHNNDQSSTSGVNGSSSTSGSAGSSSTEYNQDKNKSSGASSTTGTTSSQTQYPTNKTGSSTGATTTSGSQTTTGNQTTSGTLGTSQAGTPSTNDNSSRTTSQNITGINSESSNQWRAEDRVMVTTDEIPSGLKVTLTDNKYKGWENSTVFQNRSTNEYLIEIRDGSQSKTFYFDKDGKAKEDKK